MQQLITGLLLVVLIPLNVFRASLCPSSGAYQLQQQPLVYRRNVLVAVLLVVVDLPSHTVVIQLPFSQLWLLHLFCGLLEPTFSSYTDILRGSCFYITQSVFITLFMICVQYMLPPSRNSRLGKNWTGNRVACPISWVMPWTKGDPLP